MADSAAKQLMKNLFGIGEVGVSMASGAAAQVPAGLAGILHGARTGNIPEAGQATTDVQDFLTYKPQSKEGQAGMEAAGIMVKQVVEKVGLDKAHEVWREHIVPRLQKTYGPAVGGALAAGGLSILMTMGPGPKGVKGIPKGQKGAIGAWHASPHDFDKFSMDKIGTGEGAQSYGHGLYFAESQDVSGPSGEYVKRFSVNDDRARYNKVLIDDMEDGPMANALSAIKEEVEDGVSLEAAKESAKESLSYRAKYYANDPAYAGWVKDAEESIAKIDDVDMSLLRWGNKARSYQVNIDASPDELLDYDVPIAEQPNVLKAIWAMSEKHKKLTADLNAESADMTEADYDALRKERRIYAPFAVAAKKPDKYSGNQLLHAITDGQRDSESFRRATELLREAGLKGIKYKDGLSRGTEGGTSNYVIFDDKLISIMKKYGISAFAAQQMIDQGSDDGL